MTMKPADHGIARVREYGLCNHKRIPDVCAAPLAPFRGWIAAPDTLAAGVAR